MTTTEDDDAAMIRADDRLAELERLVRQLLQDDAPTSTPRSVLPDGWPGPVAAGELVESAWGNAVASKMGESRTGIADLNTAVAAKATVRTNMSPGYPVGNYPLNIRFGTVVVTLGAFGLANISYGGDNMPGVWTALVCNGDTNTTNGGASCGVHSNDPPGLTIHVQRADGSPGSGTFRVNFITLGLS